MLVLMLQRLRPLVDAGHRLVVATSDTTGDDAVANLGFSLGIPVVRGPEGDVLARFALTLQEHPASDLVRLTADCPLHDPMVVQAAISHHHARGADYTSNTLVRTYPDGLDVEVVRADALRVAFDEATDPDEREHVTPFIYRRPSRFRLAQLTVSDDAGDERWTVDTPEDLERLRATVDTLADPVSAGWQELLQLFGRRRRGGSARLRPLRSEDPDGLGPWLRRWEVLVDEQVVGTTSVTVDDGAGWASFDVPADILSEVRALLKAALGADAQVGALREGT